MPSSLKDNRPERGSVGAFLRSQIKSEAKLSFVSAYFTVNAYDALREQVKRNAERFPEDFMFQLTESEVDSMVSQSAIPSRQHLGGSLPFAFTEQRVAALAAVLRSERAVEVSIHIARVFVAMRRVTR